MKNDNYEEIITLKSRLISCPHGFSTRYGGVSEGIFASLNLGMNRGDDKEKVTENWRRFLESCGITNNEFVCGAQVHSNNVHIADYCDLRPAYGPGQLIEADGYVTDKIGIPLAVFVADCVPVLLYDDVNRVIGAIHCGWRSTVADIQNETIRKMILLGAREDCIKVCIGPAIFKCCFEVGYEVIEAVRKLIGERAGECYDLMNDKYMLDLREVVKIRFEMLGVPQNNIDMIGECTKCNPDRYWSHRFGGTNRGSMACVIEMK